MLILPACPEVKRVALSISYHLQDAHEPQEGLNCLPVISMSGPTAYLLDCIYTIREKDIINWARSKSMRVEHRMTGFCKIYQLKSGEMPVVEDKINIFILVPRPVLAPDTVPTVVKPPASVAAPGMPPPDRYPWWTQDQLFAPLPPAKPDVLYRFLIQTPIGGGMNVHSIVELSVGDTLVLEVGQQVKALDDPCRTNPVSFMHSMHHVFPL